MADFKKRADDLINNYRRDIEDIHKKYNPGISLPGEFSVTPADVNEDALRRQQESHNLNMEKTHKINPATGQWEPIKRTNSRTGFRGSANENYWLKQAQNQGLDVKSIDDVIALQKSLGVTADGKWGKASMAAYNAQVSRKPSPYVTGDFEQGQSGVVQESTQNRPRFLPEPFVPSEYKPGEHTQQKPRPRPANPSRRVNAVGTAQQRAGSNPIRGLSNYQSNGVLRDAIVGIGNLIDKKFITPVMQIETNNNAGPFNKRKYQQGGVMQPQDEEQAFVQYIAQIFGVKTQGDLKKVVQSLGKQGMQQLQTAFKQGVSPEQIRNQMGNNQQAQYAKHGARLCPEGTRLVFKAGGCMCQKMQDGGEAKKRFTAKPPIKKKNINPNDTIHIGGKPRDISGGKTKYPKLSNAEYRKLPSSKKVDVDLKDQAAGRSASKHRFGGIIQRFGKGGQMGGEFQDGIGMESFADKIVGRPSMKCGGKTRKKLVSKKK